MAEKLERRFLAGGESEPVSYADMRDQIGGDTGAILASVEQRASGQGYSQTEIQRTTDFLKARAALLRNGLKQDMDYSFLRLQVAHWFGMAREVVQSSNSLETQDSVIRKSLDAVQGLLIVNGALTDEAKQQLVSQGEPEADKSATSGV